MHEEVSVLNAEACENGGDFVSFTIAIGVLTELDVLAVLNIDAVAIRKDAECLSKPICEDAWLW